MTQSSENRRTGKRLSLGQLLSWILLAATRPMIGGQAVIEGVMMRSPKSFAVAVRRPGGAIVVREEKWLSFSARLPFLRWPFLRGATMLIESMYNGLSALNFSAEQAMVEEDDEGELTEAAKGVVESQTKGPSKGMDWALMGTMALSVGLGIALFKGVPHLTAWGLGEYLGSNGASALPMDSVGFHLVDGGIKLSLFVGYILLISRMEDVRRLFMYHGAEHKSVHVWEAEEDLDVDNARVKPTAHPRCGTSLILLVIATSIFVFAATFPFIPLMSETGWIQAVLSLGIKIPLMLPVAGLAYEAQRKAAKSPGNLLVRFFVAPGMLMQRLTTREPDDDQLEVALTALRKTVWREAQHDGDQKSDQPPPAEVRTLEVFDNFEEVLQKVA